MKILVINPVGTSRWDETDKKIYQSFASPETEVDIISLKEGPVSIETRKTEADVIPRIVETALGYNENYDAIIVNCCADPGVDVIRSLVEKPVIGPCEASLALATVLGKKIGIITVSKTGIPIFEELVKKLNFKDFVVSIRAIGISVPEIEKDIQKTIDLLLEECEKAEEEGSEVIILGCTGFAGLAEKLQEHMDIPIVDPVGAAVKLAENLISLKLNHSKKRYFS